MARVVVLNNYPLETVWEEVRQGDKPDHHLYGINHFHQQGFEVELVPFETKSSLAKMLSRLADKTSKILPLGDLNQQWSALQVLDRADLIYAPCQTQTHLLSYLRAIGLLRTPIVCLAHHPLNRGRLASLRLPSTQLMVKGIDAFPSLSRQVAQEINIVSSLAKSHSLQWGPDARYYPQASDVGHEIVAAGRTGRDFVTFGLAASQAHVPAHIICLESSIHTLFSTFGDQVKITIRPDHAHMKYPELIEFYQTARVIAIPMVKGFSLCGLTSLMDALGMGKPVIMTRNPLIDIDIEREGIGKWVEPGDVDGWEKAILFFKDNKQEAFEMGKRARKLVESGINSESFANQIMEIFSSLTSNL